MMLTREIYNAIGCHKKGAYLVIDQNSIKMYQLLKAMSERVKLIKIDYQTDNLQAISRRTLD